MCPQLYMNYKLRSVAHLPWRMLTYKALNTFIDDLFAYDAHSALGLHDGASVSAGGCPFARCFRSLIVSARLCPCVTFYLPLF
jgi:hypothetical protein